jgi:hypothetical protein
VTLPDEPLEIIEMPEFKQGVALAYCDSPGALERDRRLSTAVSPIPKQWTRAQADSFLREYNERSIHNLTIHEAMPGTIYSSRMPTSIRRRCARCCRPGRSSKAGPCIPNAS